MDLFSKTAKKNDSFFYQIGEVQTYKVWTRPTYDKIKFFLEKLKTKSNILSEYKTSLIGGVLFSFEDTWDVDFCLNGKINSFQKLQDDLHLMYEVSLNEFQLLIDVQWMDTLLPSISFGDLYSEKYTNTKLEFIKLNPVQKKINNDVYYNDLLYNDECENVSEYLVRGYHKKFSSKKKFINKILQYPNKLLKYSFPVEDVLNNDEDYFLQNTNRT